MELPLSKVMLNNTFAVFDAENKHVFNIEDENDAEVLIRIVNAYADTVQTLELCQAIFSDVKKQSHVGESTVISCSNKITTTLNKLGR